MSDSNVQKPPALSGMFRDDLRYVAKSGGDFILVRGATPQQVADLTGFPMLDAGELFLRKLREAADASHVEWSVVEETEDDANASDGDKRCLSILVDRAWSSFANAINASRGGLVLHNLDEAFRRFGIGDRLQSLDGWSFGSFRKGLSNILVSDDAIPTPHGRRGFINSQADAEAELAAAAEVSRRIGQRERDAAERKQAEMDVAAEKRRKERERVEADHAAYCEGLLAKIRDAAAKTKFTDESRRILASGKKRDVKRLREAIDTTIRFEMNIGVCSVVDAGIEIFLEAIRRSSQVANEANHVDA